MKRDKKTLQNISIILTILCFNLFLLNNVNFISAQGGNHQLMLNKSLEMMEYSSIKGNLQNNISIDLNLPSNAWNITNIALNFTDIGFDREIKSIEDTHYGDYYRIYYQNPTFRRYGLGVQIKLDFPSLIYGAYLYGYHSVTTTQIAEVQIQGYDPLNNIPNGTIYVSQNINMSTTEGWYYQNFSSPILLSKGNYFLVLYRTSFSSNNAYYWFYNKVDPKDPTLYISEFINSWETGVDVDQNTPFLYKLKYEIKTFYPEEINITVHMNNYSYDVINGAIEGEGSLTQTFENYNPNNEILYLPVFNSASDTLHFNVSFNINFEKKLLSTGSIKIQDGLTNEWIFTPIIQRTPLNQSLTFSYPNSWVNISIFRDEVNVTSDVKINLTDNYIFIPNNTIIGNAEWEIRAYSVNIPFSINTPKLEFFLGQELRFSLNTPYPEGNYTFILIDSVDTVEYTITKTIPFENNLFSYNLASNLPEGIYTAYLYWNNETDAGVQVQDFLIKLPIAPEFDPSLLILIGIVIGIIASSGIGSYIGISKIQKNRKYKGDKILEKCIDILNLNYLIVTDNRSGIDVYSQSFGEQKLDPSLISGFLQAVREFGTEAAVDKGSRTIKIDYKKSVILMTEFVTIRIILNMKDTPSENFYYDIESLAYDVYKNYGKAIEDFRGNVKQFQGIKELVEKHLNTTFIYPLEVITSETIKLSQSEREMVNKTLNFMKEHNFDYIYSIYLLPENECSPKDAQTILSLIAKGIFKPKK